MANTVRSTTRVLIVDPDEASRSALSRGLENAGYRVEEAQSVPEALEAMKARVPHLVFMDVTIGKTGKDDPDHTKRSNPGPGGVTAEQFLALRKNKSKLSSIPLVAIVPAQKTSVAKNAARHAAKVAAKNAAKEAAQKGLPPPPPQPKLVVQAASAKAQKLADPAARALKLGANDVLRRPIQMREVLQKALKHTRELKRFSVVFAPGAAASVPVARFRIGAKIISANEVGFLLEAPVKLAKDLEVEVRSGLLEQLGCSSTLFRRTNITARSLEEGHFINDVSMVGIDPKLAEKMRKKRAQAKSK